MSPVQKIKKRLMGKYLYYTCKNEGKPRCIGAYIGKVIDVTSGFTVLVKTNHDTSPVALDITKLNKQHLNGDVVILQKAI